MGGRIASPYGVSMFSYKEDGIVKTNKVNMGLNELPNTVTNLTLALLLFGHVILLWPLLRQT